MEWVADLSWVPSATDPSLVRGQRVVRRAGALASEVVADLLPGATSYTDLGPLLEGVEYGYRVVAYNDAGEAPSAEVAGVPLAPPLSPSGLSLSFRRAASTAS